MTSLSLANDLVQASLSLDGKYLFIQDEMKTFVHPKPEECDGPLFVDYGLGLMEINPQLMRSKRTLGHFGSIPGYRAFVGHFTDHGVTMVILHNSDTDGGFPILDGLLGTVLNHAGQKQGESAQEKSADFPILKGSYLGQKPVGLSLSTSVWKLTQSASVAILLLQQTKISTFCGVCAAEVGRAG